MFSARRFRIHRPALALTASLALLAVASPALGAARRPIAARHAHSVTMAASIASALERATGHSASQLTTRSTCGASTGRIRCYARVLTVRSTDRPVTPLSVPSATAATGTPQAYTAGFLQWAYDTTWLSANRGSADTVAIVDAYGDSTAYSDMEVFRAANGLPSLPACSGTVTTSCFERVNQNGSTTGLPGNSADETGGWNVEESLDIDAVSSLCPLCKIVMVEANTDDAYGASDMETAVQTAAALGANQISMSWGTDTTYPASYFSSPYSSITNSAMFAAAGDGSYPGPDVGYPAALADVTAVGGTSLTANAAVARGFDESAWSYQANCGNGSPCGTESGCDTSQAKPLYQATVTTDCAGRAYNDVSADGDPNTGLEIYDSQPGSEGCGPGGWCLVGGTSLATPLVAAYHAITGISDTTPAWTYANAALLNDVVSGSDGSCPRDWLLICNAARGWDGPTGNGSISGDLTSGGPQIGGSSASGANATDVTFSGGVYPNGEATDYHWLYWPSSQSSSSGTSTASGRATGTALQPLSDTICGTLTPGTTYDYELLASNTSASVTGYQGSFTTAATESGPLSSSAPAINGLAVIGDTLTATDAGWEDVSCNSAPSYAWQESTSSGGPWTTVGTGLSYALSSSDLGEYLRFTSTESNSAGSTTLSSPVTGPVSAPTPSTPPSSSSTPSTTTTRTTSSTSTPTSGSTTSSSKTSVRFYRCARTCTLLNTHGATRYRPRKADLGHYIKRVITVQTTTGNTVETATTTRWTGPISAATAGSIGVGRGARVASRAVIRGTTGRALATVRVARHSATRLTLLVRRATSARTRVWAYLLAGGRVVSATRAWSLGRPALLSFTLRRGQTVRLVAVRT